MTITCSGLVRVLQSEEGPDGQLMLYAGMVEQGLLLQLLKLLRIEAEGVRSVPAWMNAGLSASGKKWSIYYRGDPCVIGWQTDTHTI